MSIKKLFGLNAAAARGSAAPAATAVNAAGGRAYEGSSFHKLASVMCLSMLQDTFYSKAEAQGDLIIQLANEVTPEELAKIILYARINGLVRSAPLLGLAVLSTRDSYYFRKIFSAVVRNGKDLRDFTILLKSGAVRKGLGTAPRKEIGKMLVEMDPYQYIKYGSAGQQMSFKDMIMLTHPKPSGENVVERENLLRYVANITHRETKQPTWDPELLPAKIKTWREFSALPSGNPRRLELLALGTLPHEAVTGSGELNQSEWMELAKTMPYTATLRNLNTMNRKGLWTDPLFTAAIAAKLSNVEQLRRAGVFPVQLYTAYRNLAPETPPQIREALASALDSVAGLMEVNGRAYLSVDVSGSMSMMLAPANTNRNTNYNTTARDAAGLIASTILKSNQGPSVITTFDTHIREEQGILRGDTVLTTIQEVSRNGGGTNVGLVLEDVLRRGPKNFDFVVAVTDNESWVSTVAGRGTATASQVALQACLKINPDLKVVFVKAMFGSPTDQVDERSRNVLHVSGFSDATFQALHMFLNGKIDKLEEIIRAIDI